MKSIFSLSALLLMTLTLSAAEKPMIRVQVQSVEALHQKIHNLEQFIKSFAMFDSGFAFEAEPKEGDGIPTWEQVIRRKVFDPRLLPGVDLKKPTLFYANVDAGLLTLDFAKTEVVLQIPIVNEKDFVELLKRYEIAAKPGEGGLYTLSVPDFPMPVYLRFQKNHACICLFKAESIEPAKMIDPAVLVDAKQVAPLVIDVRADKIPQEFKEIASKHIEEGLAEGRKEMANEGVPQQILFKHFDKLATRLHKQLLSESKDVSLSFDIDEKSGDGILGLLLDGQPNSSLLKEIAAYKPPINRFGSLARKESTFATFLRMPLFAPELRDMGTELIDLASKIVNADEAIPEGVELAKLLLGSFRKSVQSGNMEVAMLLSAPNKDGKFTASVSIALEGADKLKPALAKWVKAAEFDKFVKIDASKVEGLDVIEIPVKDFLPQDREFQSIVKTIGDDPTIHIAFAKDAIHLTIGADAKKYLADSIIAKPDGIPAVANTLFAKNTATFMADASGGNIPPQILKALRSLDRLSLLSLKTEGGEKFKLEFRSSYMSFMYLGLSRGVRVMAAPGAIQIKN